MSSNSLTRALRVAPLLLASGACALIYQVAWQREFRLIFGASTAASAAVLAVFIGGLGAGGLLLGKRADTEARPLALYARLELGIALTSALSPLLLALVRSLYQWVGGTPALGGFAGTLLRLLLVGLVLAVPTLLMGGTLPAAANAVVTEQDEERRSVALLYGANTLGAVAGCVLSTFVMLEALGTRRTLWSASALNLLVAAIAFVAARRGRAKPPVAQSIHPVSKAESKTESKTEKLPPRAFVLIAAATTGFVFFLLEVVWYRMLGPLLGGTVYSFGLILAVALVGIGVGSALYLLFVRRPSLSGFALTCLLEAGCVAIPYALGDRLAMFALLLRPLSALGFGGHVLAWTMVTGIVVFPAALVSGVQFSLLIALLGRGRSAVGMHVALAYAGNTVGAMLGSLAGGFFLLPSLGALGCWKLAAILLTLLGLTAALFSGRLRTLIVPTLLCIGVFLLVSFEGPTAVWRHGQIGVGRVSPVQVGTYNARTGFVRSLKRSIRWEAEGVESSVAVGVDDGALRFIVNGKVDGNARTDAATQIMAGLVGALLHPHPVSSLVIGLGTGSSAGWLGAIPEMERVDVVELEPQVARVARDCASVNHDVLDNPKVHIQFADAREVLLTGKSRYSLIASEPSNPYRAGVASLYSQEFYQAVERRLDEDGIFLQWLQAYDVDAETVRTVYATLHSVFPSIETWQLHPSDLLLVASRKPIDYSASNSVSKLRQRVLREPYKSALLASWRVDDLEGFFAHYVARPSLADAIATDQLRVHADLATDDRSPLEFRFARDVGLTGAFSVMKVREVAAVRGEDLPPFAEGPAEGSISRERVEDERAGFQLERATSGAITAGWSLDQERRAEALALYSEGNTVRALATWATQKREPSTPTELGLVAEGMVDASPEGNMGAALRAIEALRRVEPVEANAILCRLQFKQAHISEAADAFIAAFTAYQHDPWPSMPVMERALRIAPDLAAAAPARARAIFDLLGQPFAGFAEEERRLAARLAIATRLSPADAPQAVLDSLAPYEPNVPWQPAVLVLRRDIYRATSNPLAARAQQELEAYLAAEPAQFQRGLLPETLEGL